MEAQPVSSVESEAPVWLQSETLWVPGLQLLFLPLLPFFVNAKSAMDEGLSIASSFLFKVNSCVL